MLGLSLLSCSRYHPYGMNQTYHPVFVRSSYLCSPVAGSAFGTSHFRGHLYVRSRYGLVTRLRPFDGCVTRLQDFGFPPSCYPSYRVLDFTLAGLTPAEQTSLCWTHIRKIDIPDNLVLELKKWKLACPFSEHELMFPSKEGEITCHDNAIKRYYEPALRKAGLRHVSFHSLRHTNASLRIRVEQNVKYMSMQTGHPSIKITLDTYGHLFNDEVFNRQQVDLLQETFHSVGKTPPKCRKGISRIS